MKRLCIYSLSATDNTKYRYSDHTIRTLREYCAEIAVVIGGDGASEAEAAWKDAADAVIAGRCQPCGQARWREGLMTYGADRLQSFDEVILLDDRCVGPVWAPDELFARMAEGETDFWGLAVCCSGEKGSPAVLWPHFLAARGEILADWCRKNAEKTGSRAGKALEKTLGEELEELGFRWASALTGSAEHSKDPMIFSPEKVMAEHRIPFFDRDAFCTPYGELVGYSLADQGKRLMEYLERHTDYDTAPVWEYLLSTQHMHELSRNLDLYKILPTDRWEESREGRRGCSAALIIHMHYEDCIPYCYRYACSMPDDADLYLTTTSEAKKTALERAFRGRFADRLEVRVIENRGRDVSALLVGCRDLFSRYDVLCFAHDKKSHGGEYGIVGEGFAEHCFQNVLATPGYVRNVLARFENEPRLGLLCPPPPFHANHRDLIGNEWTNNYPTAKKLAAELGISVPMSPEVPPAAPLGTIFWFRTDALRALADRNWSYSDFPPEPNGLDGTILHALERIYPYAVQQAGYYCAWTATTEYAQRYTLDLAYKLRDARWQYNEGSVARFALRRTKNRLKKRLPERVWKLLKRIWLAVKKQ